jgi:hypothetical protein
MSIEQQWQGRLKENNSEQNDERNIIEKLCFYDLLFENKCSIVIAEGSL